MLKELAVHKGVIRPSLVAELESFRAPDQRVSSYYLDLDPRHWANSEGIRVAVKNALAEARERIEQLDVRPAVHHALYRDWELVEKLAPTLIGEQHTLALACFVASDPDYGRALRLPWPIRNRTFFEDRFVLWPLRQVLDQGDRYGVVLTDKDDARLFLFFMEQIEEVIDVFDEVPGRVRFPDVLRQLQYMQKHVEHFHHHFEHVAETALRLLQREPFEHLIIGGRWETLPQFEGHLHHYLRDRIVARWEIDVHTPTPRIEERARQEEQQFLQRQAQDIWKAIQDERPRRGALGPEETFAALWQRRVQALLAEPGAARPGFRCSVCGRLHLNGGPCLECGGKMTEIPEVFEEAVHDAIEQSALVRYWKDRVLNEVGSLAALKRY
jgi:peptide subunit release factor 1 (eRF1)